MVEAGAGDREGQAGIDHPEVTLTRSELGLRARQMGRLGEAKALLGRALETKEASWGLTIPKLP